ncbi:MAG: fluoride efflux transporter CrcB [Acidobacteria bacterium]|nr:MAG: fluoride efflux transporter CrcB [Acidobacteriota bacterium]MCL4287806.1 fluoride efflux transporter CrcB [Thermoleophilia bacterium]
MSVATWIGVALLGGVGTLARFLLDGAVSARVPRTFPWGTLAVNLSGALALGALAGATASAGLLELAGTGFLGAFTTFSTWMLESHRLAEDGELGAGAVNVAVSLALGIAMAWLGLTLGERL